MEQDYTELLETASRDEEAVEEDVEDVLGRLRAVFSSDDQVGDYLFSVVQHLLVLNDARAEVSLGGGKSKYVEDDRADVVKKLQIIDKLIDQVLEHDLQPQLVGSNGQSPGAGSNKVGYMIDKFSNDESLEEVIRESLDLREKLEKTTKIINELEQEVANQSGGLVGSLKSKVLVLEDLLRVSRHTIDGLNTQIKEMRSQFTEKLLKQESQLKNILQTVESVANDADTVTHQRNMLLYENAALRSQAVWDVVKKEPGNGDPSLKSKSTSTSGTETEEPRLSMQLNAEKLAMEVKRLQGQGGSVDRMVSESFARNKIERVLFGDRGVPGGMGSDNYATNPGGSDFSSMDTTVDANPYSSVSKSSNLSNSIKTRDRPRPKRSPIGLKKALDSPDFYQDEDETPDSASVPTSVPVPGSGSVP
ncbi:hypothetical protein AX774_g6331, partial [Zancudomyces culisetae]